jgi:hypothetical protein
MKLQDIEPASSADYLVTADGLPEVFFTMFSGVVKNFERATFVDPYAAQKRTARTGSTAHDDVTLATPYDPEKSLPIIDWLISLEDGRQTSITVRPVTRSNEMVFRGDKAWKLSMCRLKKATYPKADLNAPQDVSMIEAVFSVDISTFS